MEIKVSNLKYKKMFNDINFVVKDSKITCISGKNGSGKTTLLNIICGLNLDFEGEIKYKKVIINKKTISNKLKEYRNNIFYLKQNYINQLFCFNVLEDIKFVSLNFDLNKVEELFEEFDLDLKIIEKNFLELSSSEIKKVLIIMSVTSGREIIILDEPTSGLDNKSKKTLIKVLKREKRLGKIIIIVSQDSEFLLEISDQIIIINNEKINESLDKYEMLENSEFLVKVGLIIPKILEFRNMVLQKKKLKLLHRDNINDLIKDIYRNAK